MKAVNHYYFALLLLITTACNQQASESNSKPRGAVRDIKEIYQHSCAVCHDTGMANAPKKGNVAEWKRRLAEKSMEQLIENVTKGYKAMPARGMCFDCKPEEYRAIIEYLSQ